ncbi:uncharacterized protein LOC125491890 [Beta vulgaris subsp. vulgaris]|uniref:uncharacterized protein LOC125491890 n=1 Tax=Beta vulgaris subsp. vulgaris TaxID=3555 RepID=UPI002546971B|nr:uncharacterized protein LOC125491890 [Beta vulgaris subsp. vulgaris]
MSHDEKIYKKVSFEHLYMHSLRNDENKAKFFDLCLQYKNPEALLCYGMVQYFTYVLLDEGLKTIDLAHVEGNVLATYLLGLLLICNVDEERKKRGVSLLLSVFHQHPIDEVVQLRGTLRDMMVSLWLNNSIVRESDELVKCDQGHLHAYDNIVDKWDYFAWGTKIHASIRRNLIVAFWPKIEEGGFGHISNFLLRDNAGYELTTQHKFTISMNYGSSIVDCNPLDIPLYGFEFVPFGDILAKKGSDVYLIDIIGQVTAYGELINTAKSRCMTIELMDTKNDNLTCVLWGTYADEMINYNAEGANGAIIVILQFAKRIMYKGGVRVQNSRYASRLFINTQLSEIIAFKDSMCCKTQQISGQLTQLTNESDDFLKQEYVKDIFDIMNMKKSCVCVCLATIEDIDVGYSWYYDGCNKCMSGVIREDDVIRCRKENVVLRSTTPRFKIKLIVADKSGDASFMMFDKEVSKLVGRTAKEMVASQNQMENNEFPEEFKSLLGKRFLFKVTVPYNNGVDQNYSYTVNSTSDEPELINKWIELYVKLEDLSHSEADSSFSHITPQKRATLLDEHSPLGMQLSTNKKLKSVVPQEEE